MPPPPAMLYHASPAMSLLPLLVAPDLETPLPSSPRPPPQQALLPGGWGNYHLAEPVLAQLMVHCRHGLTLGTANVLHPAVVECQL